MFVSRTKHPFQGHEILCLKTMVQKYSKEERLESLYFTGRVINWDVLEIDQAHIRYTIWFVISQKGITRCMFLLVERVAPKVSTKHTKQLSIRTSNSLSAETTSYELAVFIIMNTYILKEGWSFKTFLKEKLFN